MTINFSKIKKAYVIGIKGSGIVAVAEILLSMGVEVSGSDTTEKFFTDAVLQKLGIKYFENFSEKNIPIDVELVVYSTAYNADNNVEFQECQKRGLLMVSYPEILADFFNQKYGLAVCGTHGKTTTSALLATCLKNAGVDPTAVVGSRVQEWDKNALVGKGEFFVIEADEFQNKLKMYNPKAIILTSVDYDHPDTFPSFAEYKKAFGDFVSRIPKAGFLVVWGDSVDTLEIAKETTCEVIKYGIGEENDVVIGEQKIINNGQEIFQEFEIKSLGKFRTKLVGKHNVLNATAVVAVAQKLNLDLGKIREGINNFQGTSRRFEYIGERNGAILIDDYGHHPEEIKATLKATREIYPDKNIIAVFQPHSFSRTEALLEDFGQSFDSADQVIVLDIYGSAREYSGKISSQNVSNLINKYNPQKSEYLPKAEDVVEFLKDKIGKKDVVIAIGAGNGWEVVEKLKN
ncbi:MAG: UDP-N-acetylmuramate--L-alanine ligase [Candidatus Moranbacteria bacterium CG10_big_fil_rev_8_21_14_0_10_35_21]|nr:MAG: UDP-N-acetylmuramate--L-alanine ligase [Candidatus Moranbacteria bacterium CG10_big_fil_rev_8_21_14_0_10_35_21]PJA88612.1 MAG: UDP-N-acetylmuramate--L-alanine ligase [Candidatus Moranbacteria bacterium CG_4_9_14_3_um_filter_36_9]